MDLEKQLEVQRKETSSTLRILLGYAEKQNGQIMQGMLN